MRWVVAKAQCRRGAIIDTRNEARFWKEKIKKNGGREGFPRLAAVCWAGGQPECPTRYYLLFVSLTFFRWATNYDGIISFSGLPNKVATSVYPGEFRKACAQSGETES